MSNHYPARCAICGDRGELTENERGFIVACANLGCAGVMPLARKEETPDKETAWSYWNWKNSTKEARHATRN